MSIEFVGSSIYQPLNQHIDIEGDQIVSPKNSSKVPYGYLLLTISAVCSAFGNSLEPITTFTWAITPTLLVGFILAIKSTYNRCESSYELSKVLSFVILSQGLGFMVGFLTLFTDGDVTFRTILATFLSGCILWIIISVLCLVPVYIAEQKFENHPLSVFIFPVTYTTVMHTLVGRIFSTFPSLCNAVLDYAPLRQLSSVTGTAGITFTVTVIGSALSTAYLMGEPTQLQLPHPRKSLKSTLSYVFSLYLLMTVFTGYLIQQDALYQKDVSTLLVPQLNVSCVFGFDFRESVDVDDWSRMWSNTQARLSAGDSIVLWSEEALLVSSDEEEDDVIAKAQQLVRGNNGGKSFLGITYQKRYRSQSNSTNMMVLVSPGGGLAWRYQKSHPVPIVEAGVEPGPSVVPVYDTMELIEGRSIRLGGSICFDLDYPDYIRQAGAQGVDIFLQPSWTWKVCLSPLL
jgi:apolipoprotein N-acyltransferase